MDNQQSQQQKQQIKIDLKDPFPGAEYANFMHPIFSKEEFVLMFANVVAGKGRVVGKIMTNPGHLKRIIKSLEQVIKQYEDKFGNVDIADSPKEEIGFKAE